MTAPKQPRRRRQQASRSDSGRLALPPSGRTSGRNGNGHSNGEVDLGTVSEIDEGETLVLRRVVESGGGGLPVADRGPSVESEVAARRRRVNVRDAIRGYAELRRTRYGAGPALVLGLLIFMARFNTEAFGVAGPFIVRDLEIDIGAVIQLTAYVGAIAIFLDIVVGWYLDRHTRTPWIGIGAIIGGVASMITARATNLFSLGLPAVIQSTGEEVGSVPQFSVAADYYPPEARGRVFALFGNFDRAASVVAIFAVGLIIDNWGWRVGLYVFSAPLIFAGIVCLIRLREPIRGYMERVAMGADEESARTEEEPQSFGEAWRATFAVRTLRRLFFADIITGAGDSIFVLYLPFFVVEHYHLSAFQLAMLGLPTLIVGIVGGFYGGVLLDVFIRRNPGRVLTILGAFRLVGAIGVAAYIFAPPLWILIVFGAIVAFGRSLVGPAGASVYSQVIPANIRTQGLQITGMAALPGLVAFVPLSRTIYNQSGYAAVFAYAVPLLILGGIIAMTAGAFFEVDARRAFAAALAAEEWRKSRESGKGKMLVCRDVDVAYDGVQVLFGVDFDVEQGEIIALLGTNGAGKSTLLRAISGSREASGGAIVFDGREITHMPPHEVAARGVISMPGGRGIFPGMTVRENLVLANWLTDDPAEARERLAEVYEIFPILKERGDTAAGALSGGEQQQLSLAQAFLSRPKLLMIDELSLGLAPAVVAQLLDIVREIHRRGVTIIVVEQSVNVALTIAEKAIFMEKGEVKFFGRTADLLSRPDILRAVYVKGTGALTDAPSSGVRSERDRRGMALADVRSVLEVENLAKSYGGVVAVNDVSFALREGEVLGVIGPNGAGKTTVFDLISGFQPLDAGTIRFDGVEVTNLSPEERARRGLVRRFQDARLFSSLTVFETLLVANENHLEVKSAVLNGLGWPQARRAERRLRSRAERLIDLFELDAFRDKFVRELSTGLRRIVDLACVLATEPKVLLLDEPSSGIAQAEAESLAPLIRRIRFETGASILIIEHDMSLISAVSDELLALDRGAVVLRGTPEVVLNDERVIESYLGASDDVIARSGVRTR